MNKKTFLIPFLAVLAVFAIGIVSAANLTSDTEVEFNGIEISGTSTTAGFSGEVVPVVVRFTANTNSENVRIRVEISSDRDDIVVTTDRFNIVEGSQYRKLLSLELPSDLEDEVTENLTLKVRIYDSEHETDDFDEEYEVRMQRDSYTLDILSVDFDSQVSAGDVVPVLVVVNNKGFQRADNNYVVVSIPELGVSSKAYLGDLVPTEDCDDDCDEEDSVAKTLYLKIPENADGIYEVNVRAYNKDSSTSVVESIQIDGSVLTRVLAAVKNQDMKAGETKTYDLIIVNSADKVKVFNINVVSGNALQINAPSVVTVGAGSSETVPISVKVADNAEVGSYTFSVSVDGEQVVFGANVTGTSISSSVVALTVVLVIIFVVLLIILIVLLSRKEKPIEEVETSYY